MITHDVVGHMAGRHGALTLDSEHRQAQPVYHTALQRCQPDRSVTLDFLLDSYYCDRDMTISVVR